MSRPAPGMPSLRPLPILILLLTLAAAPALPQEPDVDGLLGRITRTVDGLRAVKARFRQEVEMVLMGETRRYAGEASYMNPDHLRLEYDAPAGQLLICDGTYFWMVLTDGPRTQVFKTPKGDKIGGFLSRTALRLLTEGHEAEPVGEEAIDGEPCYRVTFAARPGAEPRLFQDLTLWVARDDLLTRRLSYKDLAGNLTTYFFTDWRAVDSFPKGHFSYTPPPGADLFEEPSSPE